jgi:hypothetical protein
VPANRLDFTGGRDEQRFRLFEPAAEFRPQRSRPSAGRGPGERARGDPDLRLKVQRQSGRHQPEITKALQGDNPKQVNFIGEAEGFRVNGAGELVDPWGTPFFFHQLSATEMEIRCAGPDKVLFTADDLVTK